MTDYAKVQEDLGRKLAVDLVSGMSVLSYEKVFHKGFNAGMDEHHPTFQQNVGRLVIAWLQHVADKGRVGVDGRNMALAEFAQSIRPQLDAAYLPFV